MKHNDRLILICLAAVWGLNFSVIEIALKEFPPLVLSTLRFFFVAFPAVFLLPRPSAAWRYVAYYGLAMFALQFAFLFTGMALGASAGLASLALQAQVFATIALSFLIGRERPGSHQVVGAAVGCIGIFVLVQAVSDRGSIAGLYFVLLAAICWGFGNILTRHFLRDQAVLPLVAWGSLISVPAVALASLYFEGLTAWQSALRGSGLTSWLCLAYVVYPTTLIGFSIWAQQLRRHTAASVAPYSMLVPVFGMTFASLISKQALPPLVIVSAVLVLAGIAFNQMGKPLTDAFHKLRGERP